MVCFQTLDAKIAKQRKGLLMAFEGFEGFRSRI